MVYNCPVGGGHHRPTRGLLRLLFGTREKITKIKRASDVAFKFKKRWIKNNQHNIINYKQSSCTYMYKYINPVLTKRKRHACQRAFTAPDNLL